MLVTSLIVLNTVILLVMIVFLYKFKAGVPVLLQDALNDVGGQLSEIFEKPQVKRAMSVLGTESGKVRALQATKDRVVDVVMGQQPALKMVLDKIGISPEEGFALLRDPTFGPIIQGFIGKAVGGLGRLTDNGGGGFGGSSSPVNYGREE